MDIKLYNDNCLSVLPTLINEGIKVDAIIADPPYGTTACSWDSIIDLEQMWQQLKMIRSDNCPIVLFGQEPFSSKLRMSNIDEYKYDWIWSKNRTGNFMMAKYVPLKKTENISVFSDCGVNTNCKRKMNYYPQGVIECQKQVNSNVGKTGINRYNCLDKSYTQTTTNYPVNILEFNSETGLHPTQKPVTLMEYLIRTYTKEGDTVLDFCMGSGSTGVACKNTNRNFIGIELNKDYFEVATDRIKYGKKKLFVI